MFAAHVQVLNGDGPVSREIHRAQGIEAQALPNSLIAPLQDDVIVFYVGFALVAGVIVCAVYRWSKKLGELSGAIAGKLGRKNSAGLKGDASASASGVCGCHLEGEPLLIPGDIV